MSTLSMPEKETHKAKMPEKMGEKGGKPEDHKAAVAKMHPEHVHKLVQQAHAGKFGPQAQQMAQQATQPQQGATAIGGDPGAPPPAPAGKDYGAIFSGGSSPAAPAAPMPANKAAMFGSGR